MIVLFDPIFLVKKKGSSSKVIIPNWWGMRL